MRRWIPEPLTRGIECPYCGVGLAQYRSPETGETVKMMDMKAPEKCPRCEKRVKDWRKKL